MGSDPAERTVQVGSTNEDLAKRLDQLEVERDLALNLARLHQVNGGQCTPINSSKRPSTGELQTRAVGLCFVYLKLHLTTLITRTRTDKDVFRRFHHTFVFFSKPLPYTVDRLPSLMICERSECNVDRRKVVCF